MPVLSVLHTAVGDAPKDRLRLEEIYHTYCRRMLRVAWGVLRDREAAEDAVHDAFVGIARHMDTLSRLRENEVRHYVLRAAQNAAISRLRGQQEELPLEDAAAVAEEDFVALLCAKEDMEELMATMAQLPAAYRDALYTRYVMELPLREAAEMLGVKAETLRKQTARAKDLLAKKLREKGWDAYGRQ